MRVHIHLDQNISFERLREKLGNGVNKGIKLSTELVTDTAKMKVPYRFGNLKRQITGRPLGSGVNTIGKISSGAKYSRFVEFGTRPHSAPIRPIKVWAADKPGVNPWAIWASIRKHGTKAHPYMRPALLDNKDNIKRIVEEEIKKALREG